MGPLFKGKHPKLAEFIENKAPNILNVVGGVLPDSGYLGIVKNLITSDPNLSPEDKAEANRLLLDAQEQIMQDMADARAREVSLATSEHVPTFVKIFQPILAGGTVILTFVLFYIVMFKGMGTEKDIIIYILGALTAITGQIFSYYFGSSQGSSNKQKSLDKVMTK